MQETNLTLSVSDGVGLEARYHEGRRDRYAVLCHPHPLYGGSMDNNVVLAARGAFVEMGYSTLRFNFRGVGLSSGVHDDELAPLDLEAAHSSLIQRKEAAQGVHIVAYSYGAWVAVRCLAAGLDVVSATLISPPVSFSELDFAGLSPPSCPTLVISGDSDGYCSEAALEAWLAGSDVVRRVRLEGVDHFYWGGEGRLRAALTEFHETF